MKLFLDLIDDVGLLNAFWDFVRIGQGIVKGGFYYLPAEENAGDTPSQ